MSYFPNTSVTALQGTNPWAVQLTSGSIATTVNTGNSSVQLVGGTAMIGSVAAYQGAATPWKVELTSGSIATTAGTTTPSSVQLLGGSNSIGSVTALQGTNPWTVTGFPTTQNISGSVFAVGSVTALQGTDPWTVTGFPTTQNVSGSVFAVGSVTALQGTQPWLVQVVASVAARFYTGISSVQLMAGTNNQGSVTTIQGTNPWITTIQNSSIAGTYAEDAAHSGGERGLFTLGVRNDAVASFTSANLDYSPQATDSAGRILTKPFSAEESRVYGVASTVNTNPSSLIGASGAGLRNYITDLMIANTGAATTLVSFRDSNASIIGRTIAPTGGGSNVISFATPMRTHALNSQVEFTAETATSVLHVTAFGFKAP